MASGEETLRFPAKLDGPGIVAALVQLREAARSSDLPELATLLEGVQTMPAAEIGARVISALGLIQKRPEYPLFAKRLQMVAMNLKNLKS